MNWKHESRLVKDLKEYEANPRKITEKGLKDLKKSIENFGIVEPIVINADNTIIGGHGRKQALISLGIEKVPVYIPTKKLNDKQVQELNIRLNKNIAGEWDFNKLNEWFEESELIEWGFEEWTIEKEEQEANEDNYEIPEKIKSDIKQGDLIEIGEHKLLCGDSTLKQSYDLLFTDSKADLVLTDPPYNVDYQGGTKQKLKIMNDKMNNDQFFNFLSLFFKESVQKVKEGAGWYVWHADTEAHNFRSAFLGAGLKLSQCLIWVKNSMVLGRQDYHWKHEPCLYGWKEGAGHQWYSDRKQTTVLEFDRPKRNEKHPTMKPIPLLAYQIKNSTKQGDTVLDPFLGSGSTMVASQQLNRKCYGLELDPKYCQVIVDRMKENFPELEIKINGKAYKK